MHNRLWHFETHDVFSVCEFSCIHANADFCVACKRGLGPDRRATARPPTIGRSRVLMPVRPPPSTAAVRAWVEAKARARIRKQPRRTEGGLPNLEATVASSGPLESSQASSAAESHREIAESHREIAESHREIAGNHREIAGNHREIAGSTGTSPHRSRPLAAADLHRSRPLAAADLAGPSEGVRRAQVPTGAEAGGCEGGGNGCEGVRRAQVATGAEAGGDTRGNGCEGGGNGCEGGGNGCEGGGNGYEGRASGDSFCGGSGVAASAAEYAGAARQGLPVTTQVSAPTQTAAGPSAELDNLAASHASQSLTVVSVEAFAITKGSMVAKTARRTSLSAFG